MPHVKTFLCSGILSLFVTALIAQVPPKNKTLGNVVGYQVHQQKQWNNEQIPKNSTLYKSNHTYSYSIGKKSMMPAYKPEPLAIPVINKKFSQGKRYSNRISNSYQEKSRFLKYYYQQYKKAFIEPYHSYTF